MKNAIVTVIVIVIVIDCNANSDDCKIRETAITITTLQWRYVLCGIKRMLLLYN